MESYTGRQGWRNSTGLKAAVSPEVDLSDTSRPAGLGTRRSPLPRQADPVPGDTDSSIDGRL